MISFMAALEGSVGLDKTRITHGKCAYSRRGAVNVPTECDEDHTRAATARVAEVRPYASNPVIGFTATLSGNTRDASAASSTRT